MERSIIHLNIVDFAAAVETLAAPGLRGYPLVIAPTGAPRARVYDMSDPAFQEGIRKGMPLARARQINPKIKILAPRFNRYEQVMKALFKQAAAYTPVIESGPWDGHLFLDVTGTTRLFGPPQDLALRLNREMKKKFDLDPAWAVATNKLVAKAATRMVKPAGGYRVAPGREQDFLAPLPIAFVPGLSDPEIMTLKTFNLTRISQVRTLSLEQLQVNFAHRAQQIHAIVRGIDPSPVIREKSALVRADHELSEDTNEVEPLRQTLFGLGETICTALRSQGLQTRHLCLTLSYCDGGQRTTQAKPFLPTANEMVLFHQALCLLSRAWTRRIRIRHLALACKNPVQAQIQPSLFPQVTKADKQHKLFCTLDNIRTKFGKEAVQTALALASPPKPLATPGTIVPQGLAG